MTIKALTNMYLLLHLMDRDLAGRVRLPYYLDEAADIDEKNQAALLETMIQGGVAFATPDGERMGSVARPEQTFPLFDKFEEEWLTWAPKISLGK